MQGHRDFGLVHTVEVGFTAGHPCALCSPPPAMASSRALHCEIRGWSDVGRATSHLSQQIDGSRSALTSP